MQDEERETATTEGATETAEGEIEMSAGDSSEASSEPQAGKGKEKSTAYKARRSHAERAMANIRSAKKGQREVSDPVERARFLLAEANVLALLELADAIGGNSRVAVSADETASSE
jgi:hypothetical protein